jgi:hypothetical protein
VEKQSPEFRQPMSRSREREPNFDASDSRVEPTLLQQKLEAKFPDDRFAVAFNLSLVMGLGAINGLIDNRTGIDRHTVHGLPLQQAYFDILQQTRAAGRDRFYGLEGYPSPFHHLYDSMYGLSDIENQAEFIRRIDRAAIRKRVIFIDGSPQTLAESDIDELRNFELFDVCRPVSLLFMSRAVPLVAKGEQLPLDEFDPEIAYLATEPRHWETLMAMQAMKRKLHDEAFFNWGVREHRRLEKLLQD